MWRFLSPILSPKNNLKQRLTRAWLGTLPHHYTHFFACFRGEIPGIDTVSST